MDNTADKMNRLTMILILVIVFMLIIICILGDFWIKNIDPNKFDSGLLQSLIPEFIGALVSALIIGLIFTIRNKSLEDYLGLKSEEGNKTIPQIEQLLASNEKIMTYENYREVPWETVLANAKYIEICVIYFVSWATDYKDDLEKFFRRGGRIKLIVANPTNTEVINMYVKRFKAMEQATENSRQVATSVNIKKIVTPNMIINKIKRTTELFSAYSRHGKDSPLEIYYFDNILNYFAFKIDNTHVYHSSFEHFRGDKTNSPCYHIELHKCDSSLPFLRNFWDEEFRGLLNEKYRR